MHSHHVRSPRSCCCGLPLTPVLTQSSISRLWVFCVRQQGMQGAFSITQPSPASPSLPQSAVGFVLMQLQYATKLINKIKEFANPSLGLILVRYSNFYYNRLGTHELQVSYCRSGVRKFKVQKLQFSEVRLPKRRQIPSTRLS